MSFSVGAMNEKGDTMSWQRFWSLFLAVHVVGLSIVMFGAGFHFFAVILGILSCFPESSQRCLGQYRVLL